MINVKVVSVRKILKLLVLSICISALVFFIYSRRKSLASDFDSNAFEELHSSVFNQSISSTNIIGQTIPLINEFSNIELSANEHYFAEAKSPLQFLLNLELPVMTSTVLPVVDLPSLVDNESPSNEIQHANTHLSTQVLDSGVPNTFTNEYEGVAIKNGTDYTLTEDMLNPDGLDFNKSDVIIFHTHTCESYTPTEAFSYEESGTFRTTDLNYSVSRVGDSLSEQLISYGFNVTHDKTYHDYPAYSGSYGRSMSTVQGILNTQPNTDIIIDLHRDAIADTSYAPSVQIGDEVASQLMFVIGTDGGGLEHPNWQQNLKFAISIQKKANELYPGLFRSILLRNSRYNQQLGKAACIIEVGATGNTLEQSMTSMKYLAKVFDEVLKK